MDLKNNGAKLWALINSTSRKNNNKTQLMEKIKLDNIEITKAEAIASEFGKYYSNIGILMKNKVKPSQNTITDYVNKIPSNKRTLYMFPTTPGEVGKLIKKLKNKPSSGHDQISNIITLRKVQKILLHALRSENLFSNLKSYIWPPYWISFEKTRFSLVI